MLDGFEQRRIATKGAEINLRIGGSGTPLLCLHGYPQTHVMWHKVAPRLAEKFTVVLPDLRGYGDSSKPQESADHMTYSKRYMAQDMAEVMQALGYDRYDVAGHDRGGRVAYRLAFDFPKQVQRLCILDVVPTYERFVKLSAKSGFEAFHWFFLPQPAPFPEIMIGNSAEFFLKHMLTSLSTEKDAFAPEVYAEYKRCFTNPDTIRATCGCYRASYYVDHLHDGENRDKGDKIGCPTHILWGDGGMAEKKNLVDMWKNWAVSPTGASIPCGHFIPEERPQETLDQFLKFFS